MAACSIDGCSGGVVGNGYCGKHYQRWKRHGTPEPGNTRRASRAQLIERFLGYVSPEPNSGCWLWTAAGNGTGYGVMGINQRNYLAHRLSYEWFVAPIPAGMTIDHLCRTKFCVNPEHLEVVTLAENTRRHFALFPTKDFCKNGHPMAEGNLLIEPSGIRRCKTCRTSYLAAWREAQRA